jgi:hypothetical protein
VTREEVIHVLSVYCADEPGRVWDVTDATYWEQQMQEFNQLLEPTGWAINDPTSGKYVCNCTTDAHPIGEFITKEDYGYGPSLVRR